MPSFVLFAALCVALALGLLLPPLLRRRGGSALSAESANAAIYRDQLAELEADLARGTLAPDQYAQARAEVEDRLADDLAHQERTVSGEAPGRWLAVALAVLLPLAAAGGYWLLGNPAALDPLTRLGMTEQQAQARQQMTELTARLAQRMQDQPADPRGWLMLGRAYQSLGKLPEAIRAFGRSIELDGRNAEAHADLAEALALSREGRLAGEPAAAAQRALDLDPRSEKALALLGTAAFEARDYRRALSLWERLLKLAPPGSEYARAVEAGIGEARTALASEGGKPAAAGKSVSGTVSLAPALAAQAPADATVFIFARAAEGPRMPLAVLRRQVRDLPASFTLDDSMAMAGGAGLSSVSRVVVGARVSRSGSPMPASGDLEGLSAPVAPGAGQLRIVIDRALP